MIGRVLLFLLVSMLPSVATAFDITSCGQAVPRGQVGELLNDLDCSGGAYAAGVTLLDRATLRLNGHRVNGPVTGTAIIVATEHKAKVVGPGEVDTSDFRCIGTEGGDLAVVGDDGIDVHHCYNAIDAHNLRISNVTVHDTVDIAIYGVLLKAKNVVVNSSWGAFAAGITARLESVTANDNLVFGANAGNLTLKNSSFTGNSWAADGKRVSIIGSQITGNKNFGARGEIMRVSDSTVTGNGFAPTSFSHGPYADLLGGRIVLRRSTCGTSASGSGTLGVCSDD